MKTITLTDEELAIVKEAVDSFQNHLDDWIYRHSHLEMKHTKAKSKLCDGILSKLQILDKLTLAGCVRDGIFTEEEIVDYLEKEHGFYCFADDVGLRNYARDVFGLK